jgi:hypothetical protein
MPAKDVPKMNPHKKLFSLANVAMNYGRRVVLYRVFEYTTVLYCDGMSEMFLSAYYYLVIRTPNRTKNYDGPTTIYHISSLYVPVSLSQGVENTVSPFSCAIKQKVLLRGQFTEYCTGMMCEAVVPFDHLKNFVKATV